MNAPASRTNSLSWDVLILGDRSPTATWSLIFDRLLTISLAGPTAIGLHRETVVPDRLLAESAWELWQAFPTSAPSVIDELKNFWARPDGAAGTAILILDALSLRELSLIVAAARKHGIEPARVQVRAAPVPTETNQFAAALGIASRSRLFNNQPPAGFVFNGPDVHTDVLDAPFADCIGAVPTKPRLFLWHKWPDEPLIHDHAEAREGDRIVATQIKETIASEGFWAFLDRIRQGRRLIITGDHGYATASDFSSEIRDEDTIRLFAGMFGAQRSIREDPTTPWPRRHLPPPVLRFADPNGRDNWLVVAGQRKWKVRGGFPTMCHHGLSLLEAAVPVIELPAA